MNCFINTYYAYTKFIPTDIYPVQYGEEQCNRIIRSDHVYEVTICCIMFTAVKVFFKQKITHIIFIKGRCSLYRQISLHIIKPMTATLGCIDGLNLTEVCRSQF